jgi:hypothetical protein
MTEVRPSAGPSRTVGRRGRLALGYLAVLALPGAPCMRPCVPFMFGHLCVVLCVADGAGEAVAAVAAVVPARVGVDVDVCVVAALATAVLTPNPTPSALAPIAVPIMILPSLVFNVSASSRSGDGPALRTPAQSADFLQRCSLSGMKPSDYRRTDPHTLPAVEPWVAHRLQAAGDEGDRARIHRLSGGSTLAHSPIITLRASLPVVVFWRSRAADRS